MDARDVRARSPRRLRGVVVILVLGFAAMPISQARAQDPPLKNGDFEAPRVSGAFAQFFPPGFKKWDITRGSIDIVHTFWQAASGVQSIDLDGTARGAIAQGVPTVPDAEYLLSFQLAGNPDMSFCPDPSAQIKRMEVFWGATSLGIFEFDVAGHTFADMGWTPVSIPVTAPDTKTRLRFISRTRGLCGPTLDDVAVTPAPP